MAEKPSDPQRVIAVEPRYAHVMPWVLIALALAIAIFAAVIGQRTSLATRVTVAEAPAARTAGATKAMAKPTQGSKAAGRQKVPSKKASKSARSKVSTGAPKTTRITTTDNRPSDSLLGILFALAGVTALAGAFYARVTKVTLPGGAGLELGAAALDLDAIAKAVAAQVRTELEQKPAEERAAFDAERVAELVASATARAQQQALQLRAVVTAAPAIPVAVEAPEITRAQRGMPLSDDLVKRLAENAVREALAEPESPAE